ncbi:formate dehydrogenase accessory sulfurtransferase FdhD [Acidaminobacter sp. JC074]|uniref:formate dehydrogenase accessory sulfurtransferase FdhD n=1 Tax=Acidaminobacter sp. JC074 TaxID=2530199 RepID=UPI001F10BBB7|nr:formate dehydrogenase accessory sulfurtransferase FdhD [Acidaminobacter sp. JC074]MCH4889044.1 formate dehydrogenase accessory sulfurtransferase FdhD [Acidaminobacter sp. JC074]
MSLTNTLKINKVSEDLCEYLEDEVVCEFPLTIFVNDQEANTLLCSPDSLEMLVLGHLKSEWYIKDISEVKSLILDSEKGLAHVEVSRSLDKDLKRRYITSGCASSAMFYDLMDAVSLRQLKLSQVSLDASFIHKNMKAFYDESDLFKRTGGVHMAALFEGENLICAFEDIGRHNAVDKVIGYMIKHDLSKDKLMLFISGRVSSEMVLKCIKSGLGVLVSRSAPMDLAVKFARNYGMILVGFARGHRYNIYSGEENVLGKQC